MCRVRVYVPVTFAALASRLPLDPTTGDVADPRSVVADAETVAYAVTPGLREWYREGDLEELEYVAMMRAARASLRLLGGLSGQGLAPDDAVFRRVVVAADVADRTARPAVDVDIAAVRIGEPVPFRDVAAVHVDDALAADDVMAAAAVVAAADLGDDDARFLVDGLDDHELLWFGVQEVGFLLG